MKILLLVLCFITPVVFGQGTLYVSTIGDRTITTVAADGTASTFLTAFGNSPRGLAFDTAGNLYAADSSNNTISRVTPGGSISTFATGLNTPFGLAFDPSGNLFAANLGDNSISVINSAGSVSTFASGLSAPKGLAFDAGGNLYVGAAGDNTVIKLTPSGTRSTFATGFDSPFGLTFDSSGNLFVSNFGNSTISKVTTGGTVSLFSSGLSQPEGLAIDSSNNLYVASISGNRIDKIAPSGARSTLATGLNEPSFIAIKQASPQPRLPIQPAVTPQYGYLTGTIDPSRPTVVITHGWQPSGSSNTPVQWTTEMANAIQSANPNVNVVTWTWPEAFVNIQHLGDAAKDAVDEGLALGLTLKAMGAHDVHFVGHSLGTYVNAYATEFLTSHNVSVAQETLLDRPQVLANENSFFSSTLKNVAWVDNYYGNDTGGVTPATGGPLNVAAYNKQVDGNHIAVHDWYAGTISNISTDGFYYSSEGSGTSQRGTQPHPQLLLVSSPAALFDTQQWNITPNSEIAGSTARLIEHSPAYLWNNITIPGDATFLSFDLLWNNKGDGDYLSVYFGDKLLLSILGSAFDANELSGSGLISIADFAGQTDQFLFALNSTGDPNADVTVSNLSFVHEVPEPSTWVLLVGGFLFLCRFANPRRRLTMRCS